MKKRTLCLVLCLAMILSLLPAGVAAAQTDMAISEAGISLIKEFEGFASRPFFDNGQWTVGYGSACDPGDYPGGIAETEADRLLRESVPYYAQSVSRYLRSYGVQMTQTQFDALVSITYNLGVSWINSSYRFWNMVRRGIQNYTDNQVASALGVWCHVGTKINTSILQRRIRETQLFLYGDYTGEASPAFCSVIYEGNGGSVDTDVMVYKQGERYGEFTKAERSGMFFAGWYTQATGGEALKTRDLVTEDRTVYAHWSQTATQDPSVERRFTDVAGNEWFANYVYDLNDSGIIGGFDDGSYRPRQSVTIGQALKLILLAAGYPEQSLATDHWAGNYLRQAVLQGILMEGEVTNLNAFADRELIAKIAANALRLERTDEETAFADSDNDYVVVLYHAGILEGVTDPDTGERMYYPDQNISRAEIAKVVWAISAYFDRV